MADLTAADPVAITLGWLRGHPRVLAAFGNAAHISGLYEAPWPRLRVTPGPGGSYDSVMWQSSSEVTLEIVDHPANPLGQAALWKLSTLVVLAMHDLPNREVAATDPVVSTVRPSGTLAWVPLATGQGRWTIGIGMTVHPPAV